MVINGCAVVILELLPDSEAENLVMKCVLAPVIQFFSWVGLGFD